VSYESDCMGRDNRHCVMCGRVLSAGWPGYSCHHRQTRAVGPDTLDNRIMLCGSGTTGCHGYVHGHPAESRDNGWIVSRHLATELIQEMPVTHWLYGKVLLLPNGGITVIG
jgi:hypothetical protein